MMFIFGLALAGFAQENVDAEDEHRVPALPGKSGDTRLILGGL